MRFPWATRISVAACMAVLAATGSLGGHGWASQAAETMPAAAAPNVIPAELNAVAAISRADAWAVGETEDSENPEVVIAHWNGARWAQAMTAPAWGWMYAIAAVSATDIWAVGTAGADRPYAKRPLVMHWNGRAWTMQKNVPCVSGSGLSAVASVGDDVWATGGAYSTARGGSSTPFSLHLVRGHWYVVPATATDGTLNGIVMTGHSSAWAIGSTYEQGNPFLLHWNGTVWKTSSSPLRSAGNDLAAVAAGPAGNVWVVGSRRNSAGISTAPIGMLWNGKAWRKVPVPSPAGSGLNDVTFIPGSTAWTAGSSGGEKSPFILRWTGKKWVRTAAPNPFGSTDYSWVQAVSATSAHDAWAAVADGLKTCLLHWNGKTWT